MSWHFSRALVEEYSAATCLDGVQSARLSANPTPHAFLCKDRMTAFSRLSRFGMTFVPLTENLGADLLTWFLAGSRARTSAALERAQASTATAPACGEKWRESSVRYDLDSSSWKIHLSLFPEDLQWSSVTLPKWGMTRSGAVYQHPMLERPISGIVSGLWPAPRSCSAIAPTITPESAWQENRFPNLETVVGRRLWPTPVRRDYRGAGKRSRMERTGSKSGECLPQVVGGILNPTWVEKLMGWPDDWTSLQPISHVKLCFWLMGFIDEKDRRTAEVLRMLRKGNASKEIQREIGRPVSIHEAAILLTELCEHENRPDEARIFMACAQALEKGLRGVQPSGCTTGAPYRSEQSQQRAGEHPDALQALSRFLAHHGKAYWQDCRWEDAVPRVADGVAARVDRLKAIGNGQVPRVAATAFRILS